MKKYSTTKFIRLLSSWHDLGISKPNELNGPDFFIAYLINTRKFFDIQVQKQKERIVLSNPRKLYHRKHTRREKPYISIAIFNRWKHLMVDNMSASLSYTSGGRTLERNVLFVLPPNYVGISQLSLIVWTKYCPILEFNPPVEGWFCHLGRYFCHLWQYYSLCDDRGLREFMSFHGLSPHILVRMDQQKYHLNHLTEGVAIHRLHCSCIQGFAAWPIAINAFTAF